MAFNTTIHTYIDFIADLPEYEEEKPFYLHPSASADVDLERLKTTNVVWLNQSVAVCSMRGDDNVGLERSGFCYIEHMSKYLPSPSVTLDSVSQYRKENEELLKSVFNAEFTYCYDFKMRKNTPLNLEAYDPGNPLLVEQAAVGAHDISLDTVPRLLKQILNEDQLQTYFQPGYRFRLINTWRSLLPKCEDRPLALCDYSSVDADDLLATDRIYPTWSQEIYHLKFNKNQQWYWLPGQRQDELIMFMTYDSMSGRNARYCPHISVDNPLASPDALPRESVETRTLVVSKM